MRYVLIALMIITTLAIAGCYPVVDQGAYSNLSENESNMTLIDEVISAKNITEEAEVISNQTDEMGDDMEGPEFSSEDPQVPDGNSVSLSLEEALKYRQAYVNPENYGGRTIEVDEGDLVEVSIKAYDPDPEDTLTYTYSMPLNQQGKWQTQKGAAGYYVAEVTASDGEFDTTTEVLIIVNSLNQPPVIQPIADVTLSEGQTITFVPRVSDPDGDDVSVTYSGWITTESYKTDYDDAGTYEVKITASDGMASVFETVGVTVLDVNRAPVISEMSDISVNEGELVDVDPVASDPDGDSVELTIGSPLDSQGRWQTSSADVGTRTVKIIASDGELTSTEEFSITVKATNQAPVLAAIGPINVNEGETVSIQPSATDPDGDQIIYIFSGWMQNSTYTTTFTDAGSYVVTVTASDGKASDSQDVVVTVNDVNRPPVFRLD